MTCTFRFSEFIRIRITFRLHYTISAELARVLCSLVLHLTGNKNYSYDVMSQQFSNLLESGLQHGYITLLFLSHVRNILRSDGHVGSNGTHPTLMLEASKKETSDQSFACESKSLKCLSSLTMTLMRNSLESMPLSQKLEGCKTSREFRATGHGWEESRRSVSGKEKAHKHKQICRIVPGLGGCQKVVYVFFLFSGHSLWGGKHINKIPPQIPGQSRENYVYVFFSLCVFFVP